VGRRQRCAHTAGKLTSVEVSTLKHKGAILFARFRAQARSLAANTHFLVAMLDAPSRNISARPCSLGCTFAPPISTIIVAPLRDTAGAPSTQGTRPCINCTKSCHQASDVLSQLLSR
jgi:hypothetical protein